MTTKPARRWTAGSPRAPFVFALLIFTAACSSGGADTGSPDGDGTTVPRTENTAPSAGDPLLDFVQCLRDAGIDTPDPGPDDSISIRNVDPDDPAAIAVIEGCASRHLAESGGRISVGGTMGENLADIENLIRFVDCMRDNGIVMGDPTPDGRLPMPENAAPDSFEFRSALDACFQHLDGGRILIGDGQGGGTVGRTSP